jgi:hypothetical protein
MTSAQSSAATPNKPEDEHLAKWYPWHDAHGPLHHPNGQLPNAETLYNLIREQRLEYESKYLTLKNELISVRSEVLTLREAVLTLRGEVKTRSVSDERKRNALIRKHTPFPFVAEHTSRALARPTTPAITPCGENGV